MKGTPQYLHSWLQLVERGRLRCAAFRQSALRWAGRLYLSHFPPPVLQKHSWAPKVDTFTLPHIVNTDPFPPTPDRKLVPLSHTHKRGWGGGSVTADCDRNGWRLLFPPFLSHTVYGFVPPSLFYSRWRFLFMPCKSEALHGCLHLFLTSFLLLYSCTMSLTYNYFCLPAFYTPPVCHSLYVDIPSPNLILGKCVIHSYFLKCVFTDSANSCFLLVLTSFNFYIMSENSWEDVFFNFGESPP